MKNVGFPCVFAQNGPPKGDQKWSQKRAKNGAILGPDLGQKGVEIHRNRSLLGTRPKTEGKESSESPLESFLDG